MSKIQNVSKSQPYSEFDSPDEAINQYVKDTKCKQITT